ncbi:MAG: hypothetical protein KDE53_08465, partial [Caldilineaceae bacterium]|nr:hypothetical protein [Caldilineaceae bacterium]
LLQVAVDLGLPGLFLYSWLLYQACAVVVGIVRQDGYDVNQPVATPRSVGQPRPWHGSSQQARRAQIRERAQARRCASLRWALAVGVGGGLLAMFIHGLVDAVVWGTKLAFLPWLFFALAALLWRQPPWARGNAA